MKVSEKYRQVFGSISHLKEEIPWTTGLSNMVEFVAWKPQSILGVSKKKYADQIIAWTIELKNQGKTQTEIEDLISDRLSKEMEKSEQLDTYSTKNTGICNVREAVRRVKFFSEDYLNKEFDIFLNLCSDYYLDKLYQQFMTISEGGSWSTHGNSGLFENSTDFRQMSMDNLAYNHQANILVANELKLNGDKNVDQILKYCLMYAHLANHGFINHDAKFLLLFIGGQACQYDTESVIKQELARCASRANKGHLSTDEILAVTKNIQIESMTWQQLCEFNEEYIKHNEVGQVEKKLLMGFNQSLKSKSFMHL
ncbi:MAG: hypothetical protein Q4P13_04520 [Psychrobacter sp.]|nr:hypothetical protein [Psychrobacter sp.]